MSSNFFDEEFLSLQDFLSKLLPEIVLISPTNPLPSDLPSLSHLLYQQAKLYARKILDLYETLDQNYQDDRSQVFESADFQTNLSPIKNAHYERTIEALTKERESLLLCLEKCKEKPVELLIEEYDLDNKEEMMSSLDGCFNRKDTFMNGCRILQNMDYEIIKEIDAYKYITWLIISNRLKDQYMERIFEGIVEKFEENDCKQVFKQKDFFYLAREMEEGLKKYDERTEGHLRGKIEYLNAEIARLTEALEEKAIGLDETKNMDKMKELETNLINEKETKKGLEEDLSELLEEFKLMKDKFEELVKENEKLKEQNEFSEKREDFEKMLETLQEKEALLKTLENEKQDFYRKIDEKESLLSQITAEKDVLLQKSLIPDIPRLTSLVSDLETRVFPVLTPLLQDPTLSETCLFRLKSFQQELLTFFSFFKEYQKPRFVKSSPKSSNNPLEAYWKSIVEVLSLEKEQLLKRLESSNNIMELEGLQVRIQELEDSLLEKANHQGLNESYWKSLIIALSNEKEQLLNRLEGSNTLKPNEDFVEGLQCRLRDLEETLQEKNNQIMSFNEIAKEWQMKYTKIEQDIHDTGLDGLTKEETFEREVSTLKEQLLINERLLGTREAEILDYCQTLSQRTEKQKVLETENRKLVGELNEVRLKYARMEKEFEEMQGIIRNLMEELNIIKKNKDLALAQEQKLLDLNAKFDDFKAKSFDKIEGLMQELERTDASKNEYFKTLEAKSQENFELVEMVKELELLTESQGRALMLKENQIEALETKTRLLENERILLEKKTTEFQDLKNRNKRCIETISKSSNEMNDLKKEMEGIAMNQKSLEEKIFEKESEIIEVNHMVKGLKSQIERNNKIIEEKDFLINELKNNKGSEAYRSNQENNSQSLKGQNDRLREELENVKRERDKISCEYQRMIERTMMESDKFLTVEMLNREKNGEEIEERNGFLDVTNMQMNRELQALENKGRIFKPQKKMLEERDLEIKRLSKIVKTLSNKCLNDSIFPSQKSLKR